MGQAFDFRLVGSVLHDVTEADLLVGLEEALCRRLIEPVPKRGENWYQFRHALIRDALYETVRLRAGGRNGTRRSWSGSRSRPDPQLEERAEELAYHAAAAEALVGSSRVVRYSRLAGERMIAAHAFDEALPHFERAWRARNAVPLDEEAAAILAGLGRAQAATALRWNRQEAWTTLRRAVEYYVQAGDLDRAAALATHPSVAPEGVGGGVASVLAGSGRGSRALAGRGRAARARGSRRAYFETGDYARAREKFAHAHAIATAHQDPARAPRARLRASSVDHFALRWARGTGGNAARCRSPERWTTRIPKPTRAIGPPMS